MIVQIVLLCHVLFLVVLKFAFTVVGEADGEYEEESIEIKIFEAEEETLVE